MFFCSHAEEYNYYLAGLVPSQFYLALTGKDTGLFKEALWRTAIIVTAVCIVSQLVMSVVMVRCVT